MSTGPRLSIGLPVYNGDSFLGEAIEALLGQSYRDFELIISDNASTDRTAEICRRYEEQDSRVRYIRQPRNLGQIPNHNVIVGVARGEFFKWASYDDLYARDFLQRCVDALDEHPEAVLVHSWCVLMDKASSPVQFFKLPEGTAAPRAADRFWSMLFDGPTDWSYAVIRTSVLRQTPLLATYHQGERTLITELGLHGTLHQIPDWLYFRRDHSDRHVSARQWAAIRDPRRASRLRHPASRLYAEYIGGYISAVRRAPLSRAEKRECYGHLARWLAGRINLGQPPDGGEASFGTQPVIYVLRRLAGLVLPAPHPGPAARPASEQADRQVPDIQLSDIHIDALVPGQERMNR